MNWIKKNGKDLIGHCPECGEPKLNWNPTKKSKHDNTVGQGICNACHAVFSRRRLTYLCGPLDDGGDLEIKPREVIREQPDLVPWSEDPMGRMGVSGLRDWKKAELWGYTCFYAHKEQRLYFKLSSKPGMPEIYTGRSIFPSQRGWRLTGPSLGYWYGELPPAGPPLVLVEGIGDILGPELFGSAIAVLGTSISGELQNYLFQMGHRELVIWFDPDGPGEKAAAKCVKELRGMFRVSNISHATHPKNVMPKTARELIANANF